MAFEYGGGVLRGAVGEGAADEVGEEEGFCGFEEGWWGDEGLAFVAGGDVREVGEVGF